jgi:Tfp pilus assembly protein PilF
LKNQALSVGVVCFVLGALSGFFGGMLMERSRHAGPASESTVQTTAPSTGNAQLPEGHPSIPSTQEIETLRKTVEQAPKDVALLTQLGNKLYDAGQFNQAAEYYQRVMAIDPGNISVSTDLGTALFYAGQVDAAIAQLNQSLKLDPRHAQTLHNLVVVYWQGKKDLKAANETLDRLASVDPSNSSLAALRKMLAAESAVSGKANPRKSIF